METGTNIGFSRLALDMANHADNVESKRLFGIVDPWPKEEMSEEKRLDRVAKSEWSFRAFDKLYFPEEAYSDGFSQPAKFHKFISGLYKVPGVHICLGPRKHAKTATVKKLMAWLMVTGKNSLNATLSSTLPVSWNILEDIKTLVENPRIMHDFKPELIQANSNQFTLKIPGKRFMGRTIALSEGRSARGATFMFLRPQTVFCDDLETKQSPLGEEQVIARIDVLRETYQSMSEGGSLIVMGNNFDERCALNRLLLEQEQGILPDHWHVYNFPAWSDESYQVNKTTFKAGPLWKERFPANSEAELKAMLSAADESEWLGEFQQQPCPPEGFIFKREGLKLFEDLPKDARGVLYCDPNLSKKGKGDSTAIVSLVYSPTTDTYYMDDGACRSFSDSNVLLDTIINLKESRHRVIGFDGNVSQESTWTNNVRNYTKIHKKPYPYIQYCRYRVDDLAKNLQSVWNEGRMLISRRFSETQDGKRFLKQLFAFAGKKANRPDDGPDGLICAFELIHERHLSHRASANKPSVTVIQDAYF
jgi:hypothetical protein